MNYTATKILIVEDDETLSELLQFNLEIEGYKADVAHSAEQALTYELAQYNLILLDVMMGEMSGFAFAKQLKGKPETAEIPIIFCTARDNEDDMIRGLAIGADDYIYKPYTVRNVLARIDTVLRRSTKAGASEQIVTFEGIKLDRRLKQCFVDGKEIRLVKKEFEILDMLISNRGQIFSREEILQRIWKGEVIVLERTIDVNITRIRHKIQPYGNHISTRSGFGYGFN